MKTFVVRLFVPADSASGEAGDSLRGVVEEIGGGRRAVFTVDDELLAFLTAGGDERRATTQTPKGED